MGLISTWAFAAPAGAASVGGVEFASHYEWNGTPLRLNGAGVLRYRVFIKGYAAAFARVTVEQISRNVDASTLARLRSSIGQLNKLYTDVQPGDRYSLTYVPGVGTELALNGQPRGLIEGAEFSAALFAIWIGRQPIDEPLRKQPLASS